MKTRALLSAMAFVLIINVFCQSSSFDLTFTAIDNVSYTQLDSIKVMNLIQNCDTTLLWPDTALTLDYTVSVPEVDTDKQFEVFQNSPNPAIEQTTISIYVPGKENIQLIISDIIGRQVFNTEKIFDKGYHSFRFIPGSEEMYIFTAIWQNNKSSIKILNAQSNSNQSISIEYLESKISESFHKSVTNKQDFEFNPGDELLCIGYSNILQSGIIDFPDENEIYTFQFASGIPCPNVPSFEYGGQVYNTVQIGSQCWMQENLNIGEMVTWGYQDDNEVIEKFCYNNNSFYCDLYGGLYQWNEMMQYDTTSGIQGICPDGWHIPTDNEWKILEGALDSEYGIGSQQWDTIGFRGSDVGTKLRTSCGWINCNGTDEYNFSMYSTGIWHCSGYFEKYTENGRFWVSNPSTEYNAWGRSIYYNQNKIYRNQNGNRNSGFSVRCIKNISDE